MSLSAIIIDGIAPYRWLNPNAPANWLADVEKWRKGLGVTKEHLSYEMGFWTHDSLRERKVYDVNWMLRRLHLHPAPPGGSRDGLKIRAFDAAAAGRRRLRRG